MSGKAFIHTFFKRSGAQMLLSSVLTKLLGFVSVLIVTHWTTEQSFGFFSYAQNIINAIVPLMGIGAYQAYVRYAADHSDTAAKSGLYRYAYSRGMVLSILLAVGLFTTAPLICNNLPDSISVFQILAFTVVSTLFMEYVKSLARSKHKNDISAWIDVTYAIVLVLLSTTLTLLFGIEGYAWAIVIAPVVAAAPFSPSLGAPLITWPKNDVALPKGFWRYGVFTAMGAITSQLFFSVDYVQMGRLLPDSERVIALYRICSIIPMAMLVLPSAVAATDFVSNSERKKDGRALWNYVRGYWKIMLIITPISIGVIALITPMILGLFGDYYASRPQIMYVFLVGIAGGFLFRVPFGNLLSAVGRADINNYVNVVVLVIAYFACGWSVEQWGAIGAAGVMASMMWLSGLASLFFFYRHCKVHS